MATQKRKKEVISLAYFVTKPLFNIPLVHTSWCWTFFPSSMVVILPSAHAVYNIREMLYRVSFIYSGKEELLGTVKQITSVVSCSCSTRERQQRLADTSVRTIWTRLYAHYLHCTLCLPSHCLGGLLPNEQKKKKTHTTDRQIRGFLATPILRKTSYFENASWGCHVPQINKLNNT